MRFHTISSLAILGIFFVSIAQGECDTYDDDTSLEFHWDAATGNVHHYNIYLSVDSGEYFLVGTTPTAPTAENPYSLPIAAEDGKQYQVEVEAEDPDGVTGPMSEPSDLVHCQLPQSITLTYANGDEVWRAGFDYKLTWETSGARIDHIHLMYSTDSGATYQDIVANIPNNGTYEWTAPAIDSSTARVKVIAEDASNNSLAEDQSDADFTIDGTVPETSISVTGTQGENGWYISDVTVELSATDNLSGVEETSYKVNQDTWQVYSSQFTVAGSTVYYYSEDNAGNIEAEESIYIKVDKTSPDTPVVIDDGDCAADGSQLHAAWVSSDAESGIVEYQYAIGATSGETDVTGWTSVGTDTEVTATGLCLTAGQTYYFTVKAKNEAGLWSSVGNSDGITYQLPQISVSPDSLNFSAVTGYPNPNTQTLSITNPGCGMLTWTIGDNADWLSVSPENGDCTDETDEVTVSVDITGLTGTYDAAVTVSAVGASNTPQTVSVTLNVADPVSVSLSEPNGGERIKGSGIQNIAWNSTGTGIDHAHLLYSTDSGVTYQDITPNTENNGAYEWTTPAIDSPNMRVKVIAEDMENAMLACDESDADFIIDSTAPAVPGSLVALAGDGQVILNWGNNSESDLSGYEVYRSMISGADCVPIASVTVNNYTDAGLNNGSTYYYAVSAIDSSGNKSDLSGEVNATPTQAPSGSGSAILTVNGVINGSNNTQAASAQSLDQNSEGTPWQIEPGCYASFQFSDVTIPTGMSITSAVIYVDHWEDKGFKGDLGWSIGTGWPDSANEWDSTSYRPNTIKQTDVWDVTDLTSTPEKLNSMELCIKNNSTNGKTAYVDLIYAKVEWDEPDTVEPAAVNDLAIDDTSATASSIVLNWTAPGDDGVTGTASQYDIRYSSQGAIDTEEKWNSATQCTSQPTPSAAGAIESFAVTGLSASTTYWFAIKTADEAPNWSALSNSQSGTTMEATAQTMWVSDIDMSLKNAGPNVEGIATVTITDASGASVSDATVYGHWNGEESNTRSRVTDSDGKAVFSSDKIRNPPLGTVFIFIVDDVARDGWAYCSSANVETSDSISVPSAAPALTEAYPTDLLNAFPSPANPEVWIPYTLSKPEYVVIRIYNTAGRLMRTLKLGRREPGAYTSREKAAYWDGRDEAGEMVSSGIYFYRFEAGSFCQIRKMIVLR